MSGGGAPAGWSRGRLAALAGPAGVALGTAAVLRFDPFAEHGDLGCPFHRTTGLLCPGCGATRAWWLLAHGDLAGAARHNLLLLPALLWLAGGWFATTWPARSGSLPPWVRSPADIRPRWRHALVVGLVAFTVLRNVPAFDWLAPPDPTERLL